MKKENKAWHSFQMPKRSAFEKNSFYESILVLRATNRKAFDELSPATKMSLLAYEAAKRKAEVDRGLAA